VKVTMRRPRGHVRLSVLELTKEQKSRSWTGIGCIY